MKLKSLHMYGFKSFADRTAISYHDGITGVIGPNGSGKSNIIDAIMWVMGEQTSKSLRAEDPTDIIFSGSENRKPVGFAEVTLVFTNDGHHTPAEFMHLPEISIGRRIHRSGEREYFMNREQCRLKDIVDFLLAIGLGSKSYAIIQQDRRDRIIQASPEDMREILEETAGISVFKLRRKEAQKRLDATAERFKTIGEMENELTRQKDALSEQVEKADLKIQYAKELRDKEIELIKNHVGHYRSLSSKVKFEITHKTQEIEASTLEATEWEIAANKLKAEQLELTKQIKLLEDELSDCKISLTKFKERSANYTSRQDERSKNRDRLTQELKNERDSLVAEEKKKEEYANLLDAALDDLKKHDSTLETLVAKLDELDETMHVAKMRVEEIRSELRAIENTRSTIRTRNESILSTTEKLNQSIQKLDAQTLVHQQSKESLGADQKALADEIKKISSDLDEITQQKNLVETKIQKLKKELEDKTQQRDFAKENFLTVSSHLSSVQKFVESSVGLTDGSLAIKEKFYSKIKGFVYEHISLHPEDEVILEQYVPELLQSVLIENYDTFVDLIDKCEELSISKVSFLIKDFILPLSDKEEIAVQKITKIRGIHCVGDRAEKISYAPLKNIFKRIFICQDEWMLAKARQQADESDGFVFITERGTVNIGVHQCSFGTIEEHASKIGMLSQKREHERLVAEHAKCQKELASKEGELFEISQKYADAETEFVNVQKLLEKETIDSIKMSNDLNNLNIKIAHHDDNIKRLEAEKAQILKEIEVEKTLFLKNQEQLEQLNSEYQSAEKMFHDFEEQLSEKTEIRNEWYFQIQNTKTQRSVTEERASNLRRNYEDVSNLLIKNQNKIDSMISQVENINAQITQAQTDFQNLSKDIENAQTHTHVCESKLNVLLAEEADKSDKLRSYEQRLKGQKDIAQEKQKLLTEKQLELARFETILETAYKDAREKFNLKPIDLPDNADNSQHSRSMLEAIIKDLNQKLLELGPVNERAVEEFKDVTSRLDFLITQKTDIEKSVAELNASILEIEENTKVRFKDIYTRVNKEFQELFPILFPGGHGELHMLDEENLLTTGVEILVRLPGKKTQSMSLFSGGEKALVAISLIFSLLKTTPAPFCFLDEVDAPLDEANVGRFNAIINQLSSDFQFVIITHNRRTMEVLDTIYGISMNEPGISKLVSVDLNNVPEHLRKNKTSAIKAKSINTVADTHELT